MLQRTVTRTKCLHIFIWYNSANKLHMGSMMSKNHALNTIEILLCYIFRKNIVAVSNCLRLVLWLYWN